MSRITVLVHGSEVDIETTMHDLMLKTDDDLSEEIGWDMYEDKYRYYLQKATSNAKPFSFSCSSWKRWKVKDLISLENVEIPLSVAIVKMD